jgi:hypothetical protein
MDWVVVQVRHGATPDQDIHDKTFFVSQHMEIIVPPLYFVTLSWPRRADAGADIMAAKMLSALAETADLCTELKAVDLGIDCKERIPPFRWLIRFFRLQNALHGTGVPDAPLTGFQPFRIDRGGDLLI